MAKVEVFSSPNCNYCEMAKGLLEEAGVPYDARDISKDEDMKEFVERLPRVRAMPQIFVDGKHIGGYEDLEIWKNDGRLTELAAN